MPDARISALPTATLTAATIIPVVTPGSPNRNEKTTAGALSLQVSVLVGTLAARPVAGTAGRLYYVTDAATPHLTFDDGTAWADCVLNGTYAPALTSPLAVVSEGSDPLVTGTNEGQRRALAHLILTDADDVNVVGLLIDHVQRTNAGAVPILRTGLHIRSYTQPDNGADTSGLLVASSGGGPGVAIFKASGLRPTGYTDYSTSPLPALEVASADAGAAILASAGKSDWGPPLRAPAILAALGASLGANQSDGILIMPADGAFDARLGLVVGTSSNNAAPVNVTAKLLLNGDLHLIHTLNSLVHTNGELRSSNNTNDASTSAFVFRKSRNNAGASANDICGDFVWVCLDAGSAERAVARVRVTAPAVGAGVVSGKWTLYLSDAGAETERLSVDHDGTITPTGRMLGKAGAGVTAANDVVLGNGNFFAVSGNTQVNTIAATGWTTGSRVLLQFSGTPTVKHATAGAGAQLNLAGAADFVASANDVLELVYNGTVWAEVGRTVI